MRSTLSILSTLIACALVGACAGTTDTGDTNEAEAPRQGSAGGEAPLDERSDGTPDESPGESSDAAGALPDSYEPGQGEPAFGVYLAQFDSGASPEAQALLAELRARGVSGGGVGELSCDHGASEALSLPPSTLVLSVAFRTAEEAAAFVEAWGAPVLGTAPFEAYCRD